MGFSFQLRLTLFFLLHYTPPPEFTACPKNETIPGYRPLPCQVPTLVSCRESQISGSSPRSSPGDAGSAAAGFSRCRVASPAGDAPSPRSSPALPQLPQSARAWVATRKNRGEGKVGRQTAVGEGADTHPPRQQPIGRGRWGPGPSLGRKTAWSFRNTAAAPVVPAAAAPGRCFLPSSVLIRLTTSLLATRPGSAGFRGWRRNRLQHPEAPRSRPAEHARALRLPSRSG